MGAFRPRTGRRRRHPSRKESGRPLSP
jgi:hypothetical protein